MRAAVEAALGGYAPTDEQRDAIEHPPSPLAIIAGAGSGKTAVMAARIAHLISTGVARPGEILGLTFTNKAAAELAERVRIATEPLELDPGDEPSVFTYNSFADRLIRDFGPRIGIEPEVALLTEAQAHMLMTRLLEELTFSRIELRSIAYRVGQMRSLADQCSNHLLEPEEIVAADEELRARLLAEKGKIQRDLEKALDMRPDFCRAVRAYIDRKRELGRIDYGDQIALAYRIVSTHPDVAAALRRRWPFVLLDEYQDTNVAQRRMMEEIYPAGSAITVVGDPDQSIYSWRGATLHNILGFPQHFRTKGGEPAAKRPLQTSFRSGARILAAADAIIGRVPEDRRGAADKVLVPHPSRGEGEVTCDLVESDEVEAALIAREIKELAGEGGAGLGGEPLEFREVAILCRKTRLFEKIRLACKAEGIPLEVVGLGGLLTQPEIVDLLAYLKLVADPGDNISFARIAMGPRWRVSYRDLAALARWAAARNHLLRTALQETDPDGAEIDPGEERFSLSEALGHLDEVPDLSPEAGERLARLGAEIETMRVEVKGASITEAVQRVLDRSGLEDELAAAESADAAAAQANVAAFMDRAAEFAPLEGNVTLEAFLDYLDAARAVEDIEAAQPQIDSAVKLMTIHQAKGLEFDLVFVPGLARNMFPDLRISDDPTRSASSVPYWARQDRDHLPEFGGVMKSFYDQLKERAEEDERRLAYVAFTRARKALRLTSAHWYSSEWQERKTPNEPGDFFVELAGKDAIEDEAAVAPHPAVTVRRRDPLPAENPVRAELEERARGWPPVPEEPRDELFPAGWRGVAEAALADPETIEPLVEQVDRAAFRRANEEVARQLELVSAPPAQPKPDERLKSLSVSNMVQLASCPKQFYWTVVRPLPRRPSEPARIGHEAHRLIELRSIGQRRLDDPEEAPDLTPDETSDLAADEGRAPAPAGGGADVAAGPARREEVGDATPEGRGAALSDAARRMEPEELAEVWQKSRYAATRPRHIEQPFAIVLDGGYLVRGRIDAVYVDGDTWELVDYKTGREPDPGDPTSKLQLAIYALAARRIWGVPVDKLEVTYFYLRSGRAVTTPASELGVDEAALAAMFKTVEAGEFEPTPGPLCGSCDFLSFCPPGRTHVSSPE